MNLIQQKIKELESISQLTLDLKDSRFGENAKAKREALGITLHEMSLKIDVPKSTISRIENGSRSAGVEAYCKMANFLNEME